MANPKAAAILENVVIDGTISPLSTREIYPLSSPTFSANSFWVIPLFFLASRRSCALNSDSEIFTTNSWNRPLYAMIEKLYDNTTVKDENKKLAVLFFLWEKDVLMRRGAIFWYR